MGYAFEAQGTQHVVYRAGDGHVRELWWQADKGWQTADLTAGTDAPAAAGDPMGYAFEAQGTQHVVYRAGDGHVRELWWQADKGWQTADLTAGTDAPAAAGDPMGYAFEAQGTQHVVYRAGDGHVRELWWQADKGWQTADLTVGTGAPAAAGDPMGYVFEAQGTRHVVYHGADDHIQEMWWGIRF